MKQEVTELVVRAKNGDTHAFALLYEQIYKDLYRFVCCTVKDVHLAEDIVSSSVLNAYENLHKLRKNDSFRSWMFQIAANECKKQFRTRVKVVPLEQNEVREAVELSSHSEDLNEKLAIRQAFALLSEQERLIIGLSLYGGYSGREIAHFLRKKEGTVRSLKSRALDKMKQFLEVSKDE